MLDAIIEPDWMLRYYSFNAHWKTEEAMAFMRDGSGDDYFLVFNRAGAILKGFAHESAMSPYRVSPPRVGPGVLEDVPEVFSVFLAEPTFTLSDTTFCSWRTQSDSSWQRGDINFPEVPDPDGSAKLLAILDGNPKTYQQWAEDYYERSISFAAVSHIYEHQPLSQQIITELNGELSLADVWESVAEIGY